jgi:putative MATE family efflux protein
MEHIQEAQFRRMTTAPIPKLITALAIPAVISMLVTALYNGADTYFVSQLGTSAAGAVGIVFSLMAIIQAVGFTVGQGAASIISIKLGEKNHEAANATGAGAMLLAAIFGVLVAACGLIFINPLMNLLGATDTMLPYARDYAQYILIASPIMAGSFVLNNMLRAEGKTRFAMIGITVGGILNIGLDPLFIFAFGMGTAGAAIATAISQAVSFVILLSVYLRGKTIVRLSFKSVPRAFRIYGDIFRMGAPAFLRQGLGSAATIALNLNARVYGDAAVAGMSIVTKIFMFIFSIALGIGQGYQPVCGYNFGARLYSRVRRGYRFTLIIGIGVMTFLAVFAFLFAPQLLRLFIANDPAVTEIGALALRAQCIAMPLVPVGVVINMTFQSVGRAGAAAFLSACRQGLCFLPLIIVLPQLFGVFGVETAQAFSDALTFLIALPMTVLFFRHLPKKDALTGEDLQ